MAVAPNLTRVRRVPYLDVGQFIVISIIEQRPPVKSNKLQNAEIDKMRLYWRAEIMIAFSVVCIAVTAVAPDYCCRTLELSSKGVLAVSEQKHIIGTYLQRDREDGRRVYRQVENYQKYLYYMPEYSVR